MAYGGASSLGRKSISAYGWLVVFVLMACYTLSYIDRQVLALLIGPIKRDLGLTDTSIGLLQGMAFAVIYGFMSIPFGRLVDTTNRRNVIVFGVCFWSVTTALCGLTGNFWWLFLARMGVGMGEASLTPTAPSMISDYFPRERLATPMSVFSMGIFIGSGLALIVGGQVIAAVMKAPLFVLPLIGPVVSWRAVFFFVAVPGPVIALLLLFAVREPARKNVLLDATGKPTVPVMKEVMRQARLRWQSVLGLTFAISFLAMTNNALGAWLPAFFMRSYHWSPARAGGALGWIIVIFGCSGMLLGGVLCDRWQRRGMAHAALRVGLIGAVGTAILFPASLLAADPRFTLVTLAPAILVQALPVGSAYAAIQLILPNQIRGQVTAIIAFMAIALGGTLGPLLPGVFNDYLFRDGAMVGDSLALTIAIGGIISAVLFRSIYAPYGRDLALASGDAAGRASIGVSAPSPRDGAQERAV